ncbi:hypothetical protein SAMN05421759_11266 [Roseivivax lentus]|uniref:Uncharacterized protein n=1 Tax=Roseivivax lentus TaxID=633194 RepID=A0A1N7P3V4_9RHOB|nr:hypothetical protein [Roseivivax lentus]SIT05207.1 hypothetical protein SAMN05421759_11266 [Roseivivax lentus]
MFERFKQKRSKAKARKRIEQYDRKHRQARPLSERPDPLHVEETFDAFVAEFGGKKISDLIENKAQVPLNADYWFKVHNVIAELKTLEGIYSGPDAVKQLTQAYIDAGCTGSEVTGVFFRNEPVPEAAAKLMRKRVRRSIEQRIKQARKQLRKSKATYGNDDTKLLILIAMDQQPLFGHQTMLFNLATIMGDNYADEHTDSVMYMNPNIPTRIKPDGMEFSGWYPFYRDDEVNDELSDFVNLLGNRWLNYYGKQIGETNPILELESFDEMMAALDR